MKKIKNKFGNKVDYNFNKIKKALDAAFQSVMGIECPKNVLVYAEFLSENCTTTEEIQDAVIRAIINYNYADVAKAYIIYSYDHKNNREFAKHKLDFINNFVKSNNTANATIDDNANVNNHNIAVLNAEIHKENNQTTNMYIWEKWVKNIDSDFDTKKMAADFNTILYPHDSSSQVMMPYCLAVSMYPFLLNGLKELGGKSAVPKSLESFCGIYINLIFALASEVKGAVATPEVLLYFNYFCEKEWGKDYYLHPDTCITSSIVINKKTIVQRIDQYFQQIVYSINQVASSRGAQCPFTNFSLFDEYFFKGMFSDFCFTDGTQPNWESFNWLQQHFLHWFNQERLKCMLTFPVVSYACLTENGDFKDKQAKNFIAQELSEGNSFFIYNSDSVDSLSSCCRLRNSLTTNQFTTTNGQIGIMTGSKNVITLNMNRILQDCYITYLTSKQENVEKGKRPNKEWFINNSDFCSYIKEYIISILNRVYLYQTAYNDMLHWAYNNNLLNAYKAGFISLDKQYLTIGINGLNQAAEFLGIECNNNEEYKNFCSLIFSTIKEQNTKHKTKETMFNTELVPAESAAIKLYNRDKKDGYWVPEDTNLYASYIFKPNDTKISIADKIILHSTQFANDQLDGGSACHLNLSEHLDKEQYDKILQFAAKVGCNYFTFNVPNCECDDCGFIAKKPFVKCPKCNSSNVTLYDRIIGYLVPIKSYSKGRLEEWKTRVFHSKTINN